MWNLNMINVNGCTGLCTSPTPDQDVENTVEYPGGSIYIHPGDIGGFLLNRTTLELVYKSCHFSVGRTFC